MGCVMVSDSSVRRMVSRAPSGMVLARDWPWDGVENQWIILRSNEEVNVFPECFAPRHRGTQRWRGGEELSTVVAAVRARFERCNIISQGGCISSAAADIPAVSNSLHLPASHRIGCSS